MADGASKEAQVRLTLDSSEYIVELKRVGDAAEKTAKQGKKSFLDMGKGVDAVTNELKQMGGKLKQVASLALTMGGAFSFGVAIKNTMALQGELVALQNELERATGETLSLRDMQDQFERAAAKSGRTTTEMVRSFGEVRNTTQNLDYARDTLEAVATAANATNKPIEAMSSLVGELNKRFDLTAKEAPDALAAVIEHADRGAFKLEQIGPIMEKLGPTLKQAGLTGTAGLKIMLGMFEDVGNKLGNAEQKVAAVEQVMVKLGNPGTLKALSLAMGAKSGALIDEKDAIARLRKIVAAGEKGLKGLKINFAGKEESQAISMLIEPFQKAHEKASERGASAKEALEEGLRAFDEQIRNFGKSARGYTDLQKQAARQLETPEAKLRMAMEKLQQSFQQPKMIAAIEKMADKLPALADALAKLIEFAVDNPVLAGSMALGGKAGMTFAGASLAGSAKSGLGLPERLTADFLSSAAKAGDTVGSTFLRTASGEAAWKGVGRSIAAAAGPIMAATVAAAIAKELIDSWFEGEQDKQRGSSSAVLQSQNVKSMSEQEIMAARDAAKAQLAKEKADKPGMVRGALDTVLGVDEPLTADAQHAKRTLDLRNSIATFDVELFKRKQQPKGEPEAAPDRKAAASGKSKVEVENLGMLAHHMGQGIAQRELRVRVVNLPAAGFETGDGTGGHGPPKAGAPAASGGTGGV